MTRTAFASTDSGSLVDGRLDTGDLGWVDDDGFVYLTRRAKDLIIRGGHNIDPAQIEDALLTHPASRPLRPSVLPTSTPARCRSPTSRCTPGSTSVAPSWPTWAATEVGERAAAPKSVTVLDALPVTAIGKPYKLPLRADAARRVVVEALAAHPDAIVEAHVEDGSPALTVSITNQEHWDDVDRVLSRYAVSYHVAISD